MHLTREAKRTLRVRRSSRARGFESGSHFATCEAQGHATSLGFEVFRLSAELTDLCTGGATVEFFRTKTKTQLQMKTPGASQPLATTAVAQRQTGGRFPCLLLEEVDGLSGGDRGGSQAILRLIEKTRIPIICTCNDRMNSKARKASFQRCHRQTPLETRDDGERRTSREATTCLQVRTLASRCLDLRFEKPHASVVRQRLERIASLEGVPATSQQLEGIVNVSGA